MSDLKSKLKGDAGSGFVVIFFALFIYLNSLGLSGGTGIYPRAIAVVIGICGILLIVRGMRKIEQPEYFKGIGWGVFILAVVFWIVSLFLIDIIGFFVTCAIFIVALSLLIETGKITVSRILKAALFAIITVSLFWFIFVYVLGIVMPEALFV